jgi:uncharacterized protein (DUF433 family)
MKNFERISVDPGVMNGQPCIQGTRLTVKRVLLAMAQYSNREELRKDYPQLQDEDVREALEYAAANLDDEIAEFRTAT